MRLLHKLLSLLFLAVVGVVLLSTVSYLYLQTPQGKKKILTLTLRAVAELGDSEIQKISFQRPLTLTIEGLRLYDRQCQIWADLPKVQLHLRPWQIYKLLFRKVDLPLKSLTLENPRLYLYHQRRDGVLNLDRIFPASEDTTTSRWKWKLRLPLLALHRGTFQFVDSTQADSALLPTPHMNYANLHFQDINLQASLHIEKEIRILISALTCIEIHSQTQFGPIRTYLIASEKNTPAIQIGPTQLQWNSSKAYLRGFFVREKLADLFGDSPYKQFTAHIDSAEIDWRDIEVFSGPLPLQGRWHLQGTLEGDETYFATPNLRIRTQTRADFTLQGEIRHYAVPEKLFIRAQLTGQGTFHDVDTLFHGGLGLPIKKEVSLEELQAWFEGTLTHFAVKARHPTAEITLVMRQQSPWHYQAKAALKNFSPALWWEKLPIDTLSGYVELEGKGFSPRPMELRATGHLSKIHHAQLSVDSVTFESTIEEGHLRTTLDAYAHRGILKGNLQLSLDSAQHILFFGQVRDLYLSDWLGFEESITLSGTCALETWGTLEKIYGNATLYKGQIQVDTAIYPLRRIYAQLFPPTEKGREMALWTPFADFSVKGNFSLPWLIQFFSELGGQITYRLGTSPPPVYTSDTLMRNALIKIAFHNLEPLSFLWGGKLTIEDIQPTLLELSETPEGKSFSLHSQPQRIVWEKTQFHFVDLHLIGHWKSDQPLRLRRSTFQADTLTQERFRADSVILIWDSLVFLHFHAGSPTNQIVWQVEVEGKNLDSFAVRWHPQSKMYLQGETWNFNDNAILLRQKENLLAQALVLSSGEQKITFVTLPEGNYLRFEKVALAPWISLIEPIPQLYGIINGHVRLDPKKPSFALTLSTLAYKGVLYDSLRIQGALAKENYLQLSGAMYFQGRLVLSASGKYYLDATEPLRVAVYSYRLPLAAFKPFLSDYVSEIRGEFSFNPLVIYGTLTRPHFIGNGYFSQVRAFLPILQTEYGFDGVIAFRHDTIVFKKLSLYDYQKNPLTLNGALYLYTPKGLAIDLSFEEVKNFTLMRTTAEQNLYFYGRVTLKGGRGRIFGSLDRPTLQGEIVLDNTTDLVLPVEAFKRASDFPPYIRLKKAHNVDEKPTLPAYTGLDVNIRLLSESQTHFRILFDPRTKDQLSLEGNANLFLKITPEGDYRLNGKFHIQQGEYLLSIQNLISKRFYIESGSEIVWTDDPLDAWLDVKGVYRLSASLAQLDTSLSQRVPVEIRLLLTGSLINPHTELDLAIPELTLQGSPNLVIFLQRLQSDEQEKNRQIFALLTLGTFLPPNQFVSSSQTATSSKGTVGEMLFNQLSNLIGGGLTSNLSFSVQTTQFTDLRSQMRLTLSDRLWVERNGLLIGSAQQAPTLGNVIVKMRLYPSQITRETQNIVFVEFFNRENFSFSGGQIQSSQYGLGLSWQKNFFPLRRRF
ncbi:MAG: translocation/assembly module TamB domain-containing protein [Bacteroidia bacterium]